MEVEPEPTIDERPRDGEEKLAEQRCRRRRFRRLTGQAVAPAVGTTLAICMLLGFACTPPGAPALVTPCDSSTTAWQQRAPWKVGVVLADDSAANRLQEGKALAVALACSLQPGDSVVVVRQSDFATVLSTVVNGDAGALARAADCGDVPVGGPSRECLAVAAAQDELAQWREQAAATIAAVVSRPTGGSADDCRSTSGWPRDRVVQLLLSLQPDPGENARSLLILMGDSDQLGGQEPLHQYVEGVHVVVAPYVLSCGDPSSVRAWFRDAASVDLYPAESPASRFSAFLLAHLDGQARQTGGQP